MKWSEEEATLAVTPPLAEQRSDLMLYKWLTIRVRGWPRIRYRLADQPERQRVRCSGGFCFPLGLFHRSPLPLLHGGRADGRQSQIRPDARHRT